MHRETKQTNVDHSKSKLENVMNHIFTVGAYVTSWLVFLLSNKLFYTIIDDNSMSILIFSKQNNMFQPNSNFISFFSFCLS